MAIKIQLRRGTAAQWTTANTLLSTGEAGYETDTGRLKVGNGVDAWADLAYYDENVTAEVSTQIGPAVTAAIDAEPRIAQLVTDVSDVTVSTDVLAALRFDPDHPNYGAVRSDTSPGPSVTAANRAAIQLAADDARDTGGTLVLKGDYWIDDTITIECHVDGASGTLLINNTNINPAVIVGRSISNLSARQIVLPAIQQMGRTGGMGWGGNDVGLRVNRLNQSNLWIPLVQNFSVNVEMYAETGGTCYNNIYLGMIYNGKIGMDFQTAPTSGWVNENLFIGGRFVIDTNEGTNIPDCRHIRVPNASSGHPFNNNLFIKPSIEGNGPEYHVEADGIHNTILQGRWEASQPKVLWGANASGWVIEGGYQSQTIDYSGTASNTRTTGRNHMRWDASGTESGVMRLTNTSSDAYPVITILPAGPSFWIADAATAYNVQLGARYSRFKASANAFPRIEIDALTGRISGGNGTTAPATNYIGSYGAVGWQAAKGFGMWGAIPPSTQPVAIPDTSGATLAELETDVNRIKAVLRQYGLIAT